MPPDREDLAMAYLHDMIDQGLDAGEALRQAIALYPEYVGLLTDDAVMYAVRPTDSAEELVAAARIKAQGDAKIDRLFAENVPLTGIVSAAKAKGIDLSALALRLSLARSVILKLDRRLINARTIPMRAIESIATVLDQSASAVRTYLDSPPSLSSAASYKSKATPSLDDGSLESFASALDVAVTSGEMSREDRAQWQDTGDR